MSIISEEKGEKMITPSKFLDWVQLHPNRFDNISSGQFSPFWVFSDGEYLTNFNEEIPDWIFDFEFFSEYSKPENLVITVRQMCDYMIGRFQLLN
jgi:hypothetical protein